MSAALAIAAISEVLRFIVSDALTRAASDLQFAAPAVSTGAPPRPDPQSQIDAPAVNLFLHRATPNPAGRNIMGATRDDMGRRLNNAPLILDLHYLLSAHGPEALREIGFGTALHALHQAGIVSRAVIRRALNALASQHDAARKAVARSDLADQIESLTVTEEVLDIDAVTKIWTAIQVPYRPSVGILVTTVILEDVRASHAAPPVVTVALAPVPITRLRIDAVEGSRGGVPYPICAEADIVVSGAGFDDTSLTATLGDIPLTIDVAGSAPGSLRLAFDPATLPDLRAGAQLLKLGTSIEIGGRSMRTHTAARAVELHPFLAIAASPIVPATPGDPGTVSGNVDVTVTPPIARTQSAVLMLTPQADTGDQSVAWRAPDPGIPPVDTFSVLSFKLTKIPKGLYLARIVVDGCWSQPMPDTSGIFQPQVTL
jgi:hypothetical protein